MREKNKKPKLLFLTRSNHRASRNRKRTKPAFHVPPACVHSPSSLPSSQKQGSTQAASKSVPRCSRNSKAPSGNATMQRMTKTRRWTMPATCSMHLQERILGWMWTRTRVLLTSVSRPIREESSTRKFPERIAKWLVWPAKRCGFYLFFFPENSVAHCRSFFISNTNVPTSCATLANVLAICWPKQEREIVISEPKWFVLCFLIVPFRLLIFLLLFIAQASVCWKTKSWKDTKEIDVFPLFCHFLFPFCILAFFLYFHSYY